MRTGFAFIAIALVGSFAMASTYDQTTADITVLGADVSDQTLSYEGVIPQPEIAVKLSNCKVMSQGEPDYQKRVSYWLDCTDEVARVLGRPSLKPVEVPASTYEEFQYGKCHYQGPGVEYGPECYETKWVSQYLSCYAGYVSVLVKEKAVLTDSFTGIGFSYNGSLSVVPKSELNWSSTVQTKSGEVARVYEFGTTARCWAGSMSSSLDWSVEFKPFLQYKAEGNEYRNWDAATSNYRLNERVRSFDRRGELLSFQ